MLVVEHLPRAQTPEVDVKILEHVLGQPVAIGAEFGQRSDRSLGAITFLDPAAHAFGALSVWGGLPMTTVTGSPLLTAFAARREAAIGSNPDVTCLISV